MRGELAAGAGAHYSQAADVLTVCGRCVVQPLGSTTPSLLGCRRQAPVPGFPGLRSPHTLAECADQLIQPCSTVPVHPPIH